MLLIAGQEAFHRALCSQETMRSREIGHVIRFHREQAGLSRRALSALSDVSETAIYDVEHGKSTVQLSTLLRLLSALNIRLRLDSPLMELYRAQQETAA